MENVGGGCHRSNISKITWSMVKRKPSCKRNGRSIFRDPFLAKVVGQMVKTPLLMEIASAHLCTTISFYRSIHTYTHTYIRAYVHACIYVCRDVPRRSVLSGRGGFGHLTNYYYQEKVTENTMANEMLNLLQHGRLLIKLLTIL